MLLLINWICSKTGFLFKDSWLIVFFLRFFSRKFYSIFFSDNMEIREAQIEAILMILGIQQGRETEFMAWFLFYLLAAQLMHFFLYDDPFDELQGGILFLVMPGIFLTCIAINYYPTFVAATEPPVYCTVTLQFLLDAVVKTRFGGGAST